MTGRSPACEPLYASADYTIDTSGKDDGEVVDELARPVHNV